MRIEVIKCLCLELLVLTLLLCCRSSDPVPEIESAERMPSPANIIARKSARAAERNEMVEEQIVSRGISDPKVLAAMRAVPRHEFVPVGGRASAYRDRPLPIGHQQTISQPVIVALMTDLANVGEGSKVLEIGTGSGYQAAVLAELGARVYSIEIVEPLGKQAAALLTELGYQVETRIGDGYVGWPEAAPFDAILLTAAPPAIPQPLLDQLAEGGRLIAPVGTVNQDLRVVTKSANKLQEMDVIPVRFVPMTGRAQQ